MSDGRMQAPGSPEDRPIVGGAAGTAPIGLPDAAIDPVAAATSERSRSIVDLSAVELRRMIHGRSVSCREVMTAYLDRIDTFNEQVRAIVSCRPRADLLAEAEAADRVLATGSRVGPLHGFPQAPKDMASTVGLPTTFGSPVFRDNLVGEDSLIVGRARGAGAIVIGKTNVPEFGLGSQSYNPVFGTTRNAWDTRLTAGGSSGGAAVAVALRMLPLADGSDMMGSLRNPAGWNNVVGFRPSVGQVPMWPADDVFYQQFATEGAMGRTVADAALLLSVQAGHDPRSPLSIDAPPDRFGGSLVRDCAGLRIGFLGDLGGHLPMEAGVLDVCRSALRHFEAIGCIVQPALPAFDLESLWRSWVTLRSFLTNGRIGLLYDTPATRAQMKPEAIWEVETGRAVTAAELYLAIQVRSAWYQCLLALFERHDYLILPTAQVFAFDAATHWPRTIADQPMDTYHRWMEVTVPASLAMGPALAVPAGFDASGRAMGLQILGRYKDDMGVLQLGHAYEAASRFDVHHPAWAATGQ